MSKTEHSPLPWSVFICDDGKQWSGWPLSIECDSVPDKSIVRPGGCWPYEWDAKTSQHEAVANAQFIVTACNSYYDNQKAIAELVEQLDVIKDWCWACDGSGKVGLNNCYTCGSTRRLIAKHKAKP